MSGIRRTKYVLNSAGEPVLELDLLVWAEAFEHQDRKVKQEHVSMFWVSTVFLGLDHNFELRGAPVLWETVVFFEDHTVEIDRCSGSREQALAMHENMVEHLRAIPVIKEE